jgi:hypothetical protein
MSFILTSKHGEDLQVNAWNWRPTLELLHHERVLDEEQYERLGIQGAGKGLVDDAFAQRIADVFDRRLAAWSMKAGDRMLADRSLTSEKKKSVVFSPGGKADAIDTNDLYSASYDWLATFRDFCRRCGGFDVC